MENNIIDGKYKIIEKLGSGGTSNVFKAERVSDGFIVAVKIVRDDVEDIDEQEKAFRHEVEALSKMSHRNVRRILATGQWNGQLYMVTEYIDGRTLKEIIEQEGPLTQKRALDYTLQLVAGIEHAHLKNIIHRDIKPQNVLVSVDGTAKLVDFGIARVLSQNTRTMGGKDVVGSVHYISPEQARGSIVDSRTDIYSLGVVLYEMFTGQVPFKGQEAVSIAMKHVNENPPEPREINPDITRGINDIILKCMEKEPNKRYQTASELREDLLTYVANPSGFALAHARRNNDRDEKIDFAPVKRNTSADEDAPFRKNDKGNETLIIIASIIASVAIIAIVVSVIWTNLLADSKYEEKAVPAIANQTKAAAVAILKQESFLKYEFIDVSSNTIPEGNVVETDPASGEIVTVNTEIKVYISKGASEIVPQNTVGMDYNEATKILRSQGFYVEYKYVAKDGTEGKVVDQSETKKAVAAGTEIILTVIKNSSKTLIAPDLIGLSLDEAKTEISKAGFTLGAVREQKTTDQNATGVIWQSVEAKKECAYPTGGGTASIDIAVAVYSVDYVCEYKYTVPDEYKGKTLELIVYDSDSKQTEYVYRDITDSVLTCKYTSTKAKSETVKFELYYNNTRIDKQTMVTNAEN